MPRTFKAEEMTPSELQQAVSRRPIFILATGILGCHADHADRCETSLIMALHPTLLHMDRLQQEIDIPCEYPYRDNPWSFRSPQSPRRIEEESAPCPQ